MVFGLSFSRSEPSQQADRFTEARLEELVRVEGWEISRVDDRDRSFKMAELAEFLGSHCDLVRAAAPEDGDRSDRRPVQRLECVIDDVRPWNSFRVFERMRATIERDIAVADDDRPASAKVRVEIRELGCPLYQPTNCRGSDHAGKIFAGNAELAIVGRAGREDDRIIKVEQLRNRNVISDMTLPMKSTPALSATLS